MGDSPEYQEKMKPVIRTDHYGRDLAWYAMDCKGNIAEFVAGYAPIPVDALRDEELFDYVVSYFHISKETSSSILTQDAAERVAAGKAHFSGSLDSARKGLFSYGEVVYGSIFQCHAVPVTPLHSSSLDSLVLSYLQPLTFRDLEFAQTPKIDIINFFECAV